MLGKPSASWLRFSFKVTVPLLMLMLIVTQALAASACKKVKGKFSGDLAGTSVFIGSSLIPTVDTPTTGVVFLTADATLTTNSGTLFTKDAISLSTTGNGEFGEVISIVGGTDRWTGYTGRSVQQARSSMAAA